MTAIVPLAASTDLLDRAVGYTRGALVGIRPDRLGDPTPCAGWDLLDLLEHMDDAMAAMHEAVAEGRVPLEHVQPRTGLAPLDSLRDRACALVAGWSTVRDDEMVFVGGIPLSTSMIGLTGALEITLHGWDVAQTLGHHHPVPTGLATELLRAAPALITEADRGLRFGPEVAVDDDAGPQARLLAYAGRRPTEPTSRTR